VHEQVVQGLERLQAETGRAAEIRPRLARQEARATACPPGVHRVLAVGRPGLA
jgi:hypothetical protein